MMYLVLYVYDVYYLHICLIRMCGLEIKNGNVYKMEKKLHIQIYLGHMIQVD